VVFGPETATTESAEAVDASPTAEVESAEATGPEKVTTEYVKRASVVVKWLNSNERRSTKGWKIVVSSMNGKDDYEQFSESTGLEARR
jgi:hypothetical protein